MSGNEVSRTETCPERSEGSPRVGTSSASRSFGLRPQDTSLSGFPTATNYHASKHPDFIQGIYFRLPAAELLFRKIYSLHLRQARTLWLSDCTTSNRNSIRTCYQKNRTQGGQMFRVANRLFLLLPVLILTTYCANHNSTPQADDSLSQSRREALPGGETSVPLICSDDFTVPNGNAPSLSSAWTIHNGAVSIVNNAAIAVTGRAVAVVNGVSVADVTVSANVDLTGTGYHNTGLIAVNRPPLAPPRPLEGPAGRCFT